MNPDTLDERIALATELASELQTVAGDLLDALRGSDLAELPALSAQSKELAGKLHAMLDSILGGMK
jgi:hypothetical protein